MKDIIQVKEAKIKKNPPIAPEDSTPQTVKIRVDLIEESQFEPQIRRASRFKNEDIERLGDSILKHKQRQPILVRPKLRTTNKAVYEIVFGARRYRAHKLKDIKFIDVVIDDLTDTEVIELQYEENHNRQIPDPLDDAFTFHYLQEQENYSIEDLKKRFSLKTKEVLERIKLHYLIEAAKLELADGILPYEHAVYMAKFPIKAQQEIFDEGYAYRKYDRNDGAVSFKQFKGIVAENVERRLVDAPFDPEDERLHIKGLKCSVCPERKGFEEKLWDEVGEDDVCQNRDCFRAKSNVNLRLVREEIAVESIKITSKPIEQAVKEVPLVTERKWVNEEATPFDEKVQTNQTFLEKPECEFSTLSLIADGERKGEKTFTCQNRECPNHHPKPKIDEINRSELQKMENDFNEQVRKSVRLEIFTKSIKFFDEYKPIWIYDDLIQALIFRLVVSTPFDTRNAVMEIIKDWKIFPKDLSNPFAVKESISKLSKTQQSQIIFLLILHAEGFYSSYPQDVLHEIARDYAKTDYRLIDAQQRLTLAPDEFKPKALTYLDDLADGKEPAIPFFWFDTSAGSKAEN